MNKAEVQARIEEFGIIPGIRVAAADLALFAAESVNEAGLPIAEITMTVPGAIEVISQLAKKYPDLVVGAGTVLDAETAQRCIDAGARFITNPGSVAEVMEVAAKNDIVMIAGALTPSEVIAAWHAGADFVKIFPCTPFGGDRYIRALKVPLPQVPLIVSGGVDQLTAANFILAGASALGVGTAITPKEALTLRQPGWIHELTQRFLGIIRDARIQRSTIW